jgi:hypothetical protein
MPLTDLARGRLPRLRLVGFSLSCQSLQNMVVQPKIPWRTLRLPTRRDLKAVGAQNHFTDEAERASFENQPLISSELHISIHNPKRFCLVPSKPSLNN